MNKIIIIIILIISLIAFCAINGISQVNSDSLKGAYVGQYYFKYDSQPEWTVSTDTVFVTNVDTNGCWVSCSGAIGVFNASNFETYYSFCSGNSNNLFTRFYNEDSLWINYEHISMPPPNIYLFSKIFKGKKIGVPTSINDNNDCPSFKLYPSPTNDKLYLLTNFVNNYTVVNIYDLKGQLVMTKSIYSVKNPYEINVINLKSGFYFINLLSGNTSFNSKFFKQ